MHDSDNTIALHINDLTLNDLPHVRRALQWCAQYIQDFDTLHLLHLRLRLPPKAMCLSSAESIYHNEYQSAQAQLVAWRDLLSMPQCTGWLHEGVSNIELKHFCHEHHFDYLLTHINTAFHMHESRLLFIRNQIDIIESFGNLAIVSMHKQEVPAANWDGPNEYAVAVGCI